MSQTIVKHSTWDSVPNSYLLPVLGISEKGVIRGSVNGGFQTVVRVWSGEQFPHPILTSILPPSVLPLFNLFFYLSLPQFKLCSAGNLEPRFGNHGFTDACAPHRGGTTKMRSWTRVRRVRGACMLRVSPYSTLETRHFDTHPKLKTFFSCYRTPGTPPPGPWN